MSNIDERIIEMRFDNKEFEKNASETMSTLDKLKEKLKFNTSTKAAEELNKSITQIDVNPIVKSIDTIETKMSAFSVAGKRIIENLVDSAMNGLHKVISKFTAVQNQIVSGGKQRALNIEQAKFQLEGLGVAWADIEDDISYGVQDTAYGLDAAAKVASQLVASQVQLGDEMKHSLLGISGVAAMTSSTYEDIGRIYTTVAGNGRLMGDQLLQLSSRGINAAATLAKSLGTTESAVRDMVSKGQISFRMFSDAMFEAFGEHAKSANKTFTGSLSNTKAALSRLGADVAAQGFNSIRDILNDVIPQLKEFKKQIKPLEDAVIKMVKAVGKLVQALIRSVDVSKLVNKIMPPIQKAVEGITDFINAYTMAFMERHPTSSVFKDQLNVLGDIKDSSEEAKEAMIDLTKITEEEKQMANDIWQWGTYGNGQDRVNALGEHYEMVQAYINEMIELGWDEEKMREKLAAQIEEQKKAEEEMARATSKKAVVEKLINILGNLKRVAKNVFSSVKNVVSVAFEALSGAFEGKGILDIIEAATEKLADFSDKIVITKDRAKKVKPIFKALFSVLKFVGKAAVNAAKGAVKIAGSLGELISKAKDSKIVSDIGEAISRAFEKLKDAFIAVYNKIKESDAWDKFVDILKTVGHFIGEVLIKAFDTLGNVGGKVVEAMSGGFKWLVDKVGEFIQKVKDGETPLQRIKDFFKENVLEGSWLVKLKEVIGDIFGTGKDVFKRAFDMASDFINGLIKGLKNLSPEDAETALKVIGILATIVGSIKFLWSMASAAKGIEKFTINLSEMLDILTSTINKYGRRADSETFKNFATVIATIAGSIVAIAITVAILEGFNLDGRAIVGFATGLVVILTAIVGAVIVLSALWKKAANISNYKNIQILGRVKVPELALTIIGFGYAVKAIIAAIAAMYVMIKDENFKLGTLLGALAIVLIVVGAIGTLAILGARFSKNVSGLTGIALTLIAVGILLSSITKSVIKFANFVKDMNTNQLLAVALASKDLLAFLTEILIFAAGVIVLNSLFPSNGVTSNPFKGMFGMFAGLTLLMRFGFVPLIETILDTYKKGKEGEKAMKSFKSIVRGMIIFIGLISVLMAALSSTANLTRSKDLDVGNWGNKAITNSAFSFAGGSSGMLWGVAGIIASVGVMFWLLGKAIESLNGVDTHAIKRFGEIVKSIEWFLGIMITLTSVASFIAGPEIIAVLLSFAAVIIGIGVAFAGLGFGFRQFETGLKDLITSLPDMFDQLLAFFEKIKGKRSTVVQGVRETVLMFLEGISAGIIAWTEGIALLVPTLTHNFMVTIIALLTSIGDELLGGGKELVEAADHAAMGVLYFLGLVMNKVQEHGKEMFKSVGMALGGVLIKSLNPWTRELLGINDEDFEFTGPEIDWEKYWADKAKRQSLSSSNLSSYAGEYGKLLAKATEGKEDKIVSDATKPIDKMMQDIQKESEGILTKYTKDIDLKSLMNMDDSDLPIDSIMNLFNTDIGVDKWASDVETGFDDMIVYAEDGSVDVNATIEKMSTNAENILGTSAERMGEIEDGGMENVEKAIEDHSQVVVTLSEDLTNKILEELDKVGPRAYKAGYNLPAGMALGIEDGKNARGLNVLKAANELGMAATVQLAQSLKEKSPSRATYEIGKYFTEGFVNGIVSLSNLVSGNISEMGENSTSAMNSVIADITDTMNQNIDYYPTIRPILDLSDISDKAGDIDSLMNTDGSLRLASIDGSLINDSIANRNSIADQSYYDGTNVVDAVNGLRNDISDIKGTLSTLGFYVDGKQMATAIADPMSSALNKIAVNTGRGVK